MSKRITIIQGHPDGTAAHFCHALAQAYTEGATAAGHDVRHIETARLDFPLLRCKSEFESSSLPPGLSEAQAAIAWAEHLVVIYPLWLGAMPALLKAFLEQVMRPGFAFQKTASGMWKPALAGRSARIIVTMGMPAVIYRWYFGAHSLKSFKRNILGFCGIGPVRTCVIGNVESPRPAARQVWLERLAEYGRGAR